MSDAVIEASSSAQPIEGGERDSILRTWQPPDTPPLAFMARFCGVTMARSVPSAFFAKSSSHQYCHPGPSTAACAGPASEPSYFHVQLAGAPDTVVENTA